MSQEHINKMEIDHREREAKLAELAIRDGHDRRRETTDAGPRVRTKEGWGNTGGT
jgi:hypothetical protein